MDNESQSPDSNRLTPDRKPWPMWPIALSILSFIVFYTWFQFTFRKSEKPYEPSRAMQERVERTAEKNLYDWYSLAVTQVSQKPIPNSSAIVPIDRKGPLETELPSQIVYYLPRKPILVPRVTRIESDSNHTQAGPLTIALEMPEAVANSPFFHLTALYKDGDLILLAELRVEEEKELESLNMESPGKTLFFSIDTQPVENENLAVKLYTTEKTYNWQVEQI